MKRLFSQLPDARRRRYCALGLLALVCSLAYLPPFVGLFLGMTPFGEDALAQFVPWHEFARQSLYRGIVPLWNPHLFCGISFIGNIQAGLFYPGNILYYLLPSPIALLADAWLHTILLSWGSYAFGRALKLSRTASVLLAMILAIGGATSARVYAGQLGWLQSHAWLPWLLWALVSYLRSGETVCCLRFAVFFALLITCGHPPSILLGGALCVLLFILWLVVGRYNQRIPLLPSKWVGAATASVLLTACLSAVVILPFRELNRLSVHTSLSFEEATILSGTWKSLVRLLMPDFFGGNSGVQWSTSCCAHEEAAYIGVLPFLLALASPFLVMAAITMAAKGETRVLHRLKTATIYMWLALPLIVLLAMGANTPLYHVAFDALPFLRLARIPLRWLEFYVIASALLAAIAFEAVFVRNSAPQARRVVWLLRLAMVGCMLTAIAVFLLPSTLWQGIAGPILKSAPALKFDTVVENFKRVAFLACGTTFLLSGLASTLVERWLRATGEGSRRRVTRMLVGFVAVDLLLLFWRSAKLVTPKDMHSIVWPSRLAAQYRAGERWDTSMFWQGIDHAAPRGVDIFNGYDPLGTKPFFDFVSASEGRPTWETTYQPIRRSPLLLVAGVTHTIAGPRDPLDADTPFPDTRDMSLAATVNGWTLWQHAGAAWPRLYLARAIVTSLPGAQLSVLKKLSQEPFYKSAPAVVSPGLFKSLNTSPNSFALSHSDVIHIQSGSINHVRFSAHTANGGIAVLNDANFAGWKVWVNGRRERLETANFMFRAVSLPRGESQAEMVFDPESYRLGLFLSLCGVACAVGLAGARRKRE